jgi:hypothetical protein
MLLFKNETNSNRIIFNLIKRGHGTEARFIYDYEYFYRVMI